MKKIVLIVAFFMAFVLALSVFAKITEVTNKIFDYESDQTEKPEEDTNDTNDSQCKHSELDFVSEYYEYKGLLHLELLKCRDCSKYAYANYMPHDHLRIVSGLLTFDTSGSCSECGYSSIEEDYYCSCLDPDDYAYGIKENNASNSQVVKRICRRCGLLIETNN